MNTTIRILMIEDNPGDVLLIRKMLAGVEPACEIDNVSTLAASRGQLASHQYDVILLDLGLPDSSGLTTFERLMEASDSVAIIILTGLDNDAMALEAVSKGAQDFLIKSGLDSRLLVKSINYAIERSKIYEARTRLEEQIIRASDEWLNTFDAINDSVALIDADQRVVRCNRATSHLLGLDYADIVNQPCWKLFHCLDEPIPECPFVKAKLSLQSETATVQRNDRWLEVTINPILSGKATLTGAVHIVRDVTESKRAEEEKQALEQQFQQTQKLESLGVLAGGIAHDFNNILAVIICCCSLAQQKPETVLELVLEIEKAATRAAELCRQMLAYAGKAPFISSNIKMAALVDDMLRMLKATIGQNVSIKSTLAEDIPSFRGDVSQLRQIIMNLIINAAEAIGEAQGEICVSLAKAVIRAGDGDKDHLGKAITPGQYVCLEVADTGCGMDDEIKQHIFEPFYTTKFTGRGLGMSAVLGIIIAHRGALQLESQAGRGTTFRVYLPLQGSESAETEALRPASSLAWQGCGTILLVEDEEQILAVAKALLKALGFDVFEAADGREALEVYRKNAEYITLVITDIGMPVMDGFELFRELKKLAPKLPIIISSGFGDVDVTSRIAEGDVAGFLNKPYSFDELRKVLKSVVDGAVSRSV